MQVFENARSGTLEDDFINHWRDPHKQYNATVDEALDNFLVRNSIREWQMTPNQARRFLDEVLNSRDPQIRNFNVKVMEQRLRYLSNHPRSTDRDDYDD
jgi:polyhydroxyalkanoate synthesis regulator phasin